MSLSNNAIFFFKSLCAILGHKDLLLKIEDLELIEDYSKIGEMMNEFIHTLEEKFTKRIFDFQDISRRRLLRHFIITFRKGETLEGEPTIIINDFPIGLKGEKNPVLDLELVYDDVDKRDKDVDKLNIVLN